MKIKRADIERILILCAAALVVVLALRSNDQTTSQVLVEQTAIPIEQTIAQEDTVATVVFYEDGDGYLVPVTRQVPKTDGIAKATLALMVKDAENDMQAARLGLRTVIPEGTTFDIDISEGRANVNVSKEALNGIDARQESLMVDAITNALTCFSTVDEVTLEFDGQKRSKLTYGTDVSGVSTGGNLNLESVETFSEDAGLVQLHSSVADGTASGACDARRIQRRRPHYRCFGAGQGPTRMTAAWSARCRKTCGVKSVTMKDGVVTVNFSKEFKQAMESSDGGQQAVRAILFTCSQFPGVKKVEVQVEGEKIEAQPETATTFINAEEEVIAQYPGVVELD